MSRHIIATFIGADGSLGYRHGEAYVLLYGADPISGTITVRRAGDRGGTCHYSSPITFAQNWTPTAAAAVVHSGGA